MKPLHHPLRRNTLEALTLTAAVTSLVILLASNAMAQTPSFQWAKRVASTLNGTDELSIGMALDGQGNSYVTGWFEGANDFGGISRTSLGGQDIFVAKYTNGVPQWVKRAGSSGPYFDQGRGIGVDAAGNVYVTGGFHGNADFDTFPVSTSQNMAFFLAKYTNNNAGAVQWVQKSTGGAGEGVYGTGLAVDSAGNSYAVGFADNGATITFGTINLLSSSTSGYSAFLVKYDNAGVAKWAKLMGGPGHTYVTKVAVDLDGKVYVRGGFTANITVGGVPLTSAGGKDLFVVKFDNSGNLEWVRQAGGSGDDGDEGGIAVDQAGNVYVSGAFSSNPIIFGSTTLTNAGGLDAFVAKYSNLGDPQWARRAGGANLDIYWDCALDGQGNIYAAGVLSPDALPPGSLGGALIAKYDPAGTNQWAISASGPPADPVPSLVAKCAVDSTGNCFLAGWYQGTATFGTNTLQPQGDWNYFLAKLGTNAPPVTDYTYTTNNGTITITGYTGPGGAITIPVTIYGLPVSSIGALAFYGNTDVTSMTIPGSVAEIGYAAFIACVNLTSVTISNGVTSIGEQAFNRCAGLTTIVIPNSVIYIGLNPFQYCQNLTSITVNDGNPTYSSTDGVLFDKAKTTLICYPRGKSGSYAIPGTVITIGEYAFEDCAILTDVTIPNSVTTIGNTAFTECSLLTSITIPSSVESIGAEAFNYCRKLTAINVASSNAYYSSLSGVLFNKAQTTLIQCPGGWVGGYTIPATVTSIGDWAFHACPDMTSISIPSSVTNIGNGAFNQCSGLSGVSIPNTVLSIGFMAFLGCDGLTSVAIPDSVASIGGQAFYHCASLTNATIGAGLISIEGPIFMGSSRLLAIDVAASNPAYTSVSGVLFDKNKATLISFPGGWVGNYTIPGTVTNIGYWSFVDCPDLTTVTVPATVEGIEFEAFAGCARLTGIYFKGNAPVVDSSAFTGDSELTLYFLPGTTGWDEWVSPPPSVLWNPQVQNPGMRTNRFGFNITGTTNIPIVVEASTNLTSSVWVTLQSGTLTNGLIYFSDSQWTNYPKRFYRIRSP